MIAAVNGAAAGAGMSFACACDLRIAADSAVFVPAFVNIGLVPDSGGTFFVTRLLGYARAFEWLCSGRRLTAAEAHAWGLVSEVVEAEGLAARAAELAAELAALPTQAIGMTKRLLDRASGSTSRRAARVGGAAAGGGDAERGLQGGSAGIFGEADAELQRPLAVAEPHPVRLVVTDDLRRSRLTVFFRLLLVVPQLIWLYVWFWVFISVVAFNWIATLVTGRTEPDVHSFLGRWLRFAMHVLAYVHLVANPWPPFSGKPGTYPIDVELDPPEPQPRLATLFRIVLVIPAYVFATVLGVVAQVIAFAGWFVCLALGRMPLGMRDLLAYCLRYQIQTYAYVFLLTRRYPSLASGTGFQFEEA